jgi:hypothetical protein
VDNNLFGFGTSKLAMMGFLDGRVDFPINDNISFFVSGMISGPLAGDTTRTFQKSMGFGLSFSFTIRKVRKFKSKKPWET